MKILVITIFIILSTVVAKQVEYQNEYHQFWYDTCEIYKKTTSDEYEYIREKIKKDTCDKVYKFSKGNYDTFARDCWNKKLPLLKCLAKVNVFYKYLGVY